MKIHWIPLYIYMYIHACASVCVEMEAGSLIKASQPKCKGKVHQSINIFT